MVGSVGRALRAAAAVVFLFAFPSVTVIAEPIFQDRFEPVQEEGPRAGTAFKGPFRIGSSVTLLTLRPDLSQTGDPFFGDIISNDGQYRIDADIPPGVVELVVTGNFFHETLNDNTTQPLTLFALTERTGSLNINLLTAIERDRIRLLVRNGLSFSDAKSQAINELFTIFGSAPVAQDTTEISLTSSDGPVLLALTAMLTTRPDGTARSVPDMQQLITQLRTDFETGQFASLRLQELFRSAAAVNTDVIRLNLSNYYASIGVSIDVPDFSQAIRDFLTVTGFEIAASASDGGEISPSGSVWALPGTQTAFQLTPTDGFSVDTIDGSCEGTLDGNVFTTNPIGADCTIEATFSINVYTVTPAAGPNGSISPSEPLTVEHGEVLEFQLTPDEGFSVAGMTGSCGGQINGNIYTTAPIITDCDFTIDFTVSVYPVTASVGSGNGTITPSTQQVQHGSEATFTITPQTGWSITRVIGDTCSPEDQGDGTWLAASIVAACTVTVDFSINTFTVTVTTQGDGSTNPSGDISIDFGTQLQINLEPGEGQSVSGIDSTCGGSRNGLLFLTDAITEDCTVSVSFSPSFFLAENGVTIKCPFAEIGQSGSVNGLSVTRRSRNQITPANAATTCTTGITNMRDLFFQAPAGFNEDISHWDVSSVTDMGRMLFGNSNFNQNLSFWNVSNVTDMNRMFTFGESFNSNIASWDVTNVTDMTDMFLGSSFNQPIGSWNVANVRSTAGMFDGTPFDQDISEWDVSNVVNMRAMFLGASNFNQALHTWDTSSVTNMARMFESTQRFNQPIGNWDTSSVTDMSRMFAAASAFNQPINNWDTSSLRSMREMFAGSAFNRPLDAWDTSSVTDMQSTFEGSSFNQPINNWNTSSVLNMSRMFIGSNFNQPLDSWDVSSVITMAGMFQGTPFNSSINSWNVSNVNDMSSMFESAGFFNQQLNSWDTSSVTNMRRMFVAAVRFNQPVGNWDVSSVSNMTEMFASALDFDQDIGGWATENVSSMVRMFINAGSFNQDLSDWCVPQFIEPPLQFDEGAVSWVLPRPIWGTCPDANP